MTTISNAVLNRKRYSGQGTVSICDLDANYNPGPWYEIGRVPDVQIQAKVTPYEERNSENGSRVLDQRWIQDRDLSASITLEAFTPRNLAIRYYGEQVAIAGGTVTGEVLGSFAADDLAYTAKQDISSLVLTDSAATPATLGNTKYTLVDAKFGKIRILDVSGLTQPIKAAYAYADGLLIPINKDAAFRDFGMRIEMLNTADTPASKVLIYLARVHIESDGMDQMIQEKSVQQGKVKVTGLSNPNAGMDSEYGTFGYIRVIS